MNLTCADVQYTHVNTSVFNPSLETSKDAWQAKAFGKRNLCISAKQLSHITAILCLLCHNWASTVPSHLGLSKEHNQFIMVLLGTDYGP